MKPIVRAMPALIWRGAVIWCCIGLLGTAILGGICKSIKNDDAQEIAAAMTRAVFIRSVLFFLIGGAVSGVIFTLLLDFHWHGGERFRGPVDAIVGRSQTVAEILSFKPMLVCAAFVGIVSLLLAIPTNTFSAMASVAFFGGLMGLGGGAALPALSTRVVDRF